MTYRDAVAYLYNVGNEIKKGSLGLERIRILLDALGNPQDTYPSVHIAGTNGKGSTSAMIEAGLHVARNRTGLFTSPHLVEPTERVQVNRIPVSEALFVDAFHEVHEAAQGLLQQGVLTEPPTYFERVTAMAHLIFREVRVKWGVIEVGMGGRLDATNVLQPDLTVITPVSFDHMEHLGDTIGKIAFEKAGILKAQTPVVVASQQPDALEVIEQRATSLGCPVLRSSEVRISELDCRIDGSEFTAGAPFDCRLKISLPGRHQVENAVTAALALHELGIAKEHIQHGLSHTHWPGRMEVVRRQPTIILDGAHNLAGIQALASHLRNTLRGSPLHLIFGVMEDKQATVMAEILFPLAQEVILTKPTSSRALDPLVLYRRVTHPRIRVVEDPVAAAQQLLALPPNHTGVICGSLYLIGDVRSHLI